MIVFYGIVTILCVYSVYCQMLTTITSITKPFIKDVGSSVSITCTVLNPMKYNISWVKINNANDTNSVVLSVGNNVLINDTRFSLVQDVISTRYFNSNCYTLQILDFHVTDAGIYRCLVLDNTNDTISADTEIELRTPPTITSAPRSFINIRENEPLTLECFARGVPMPVVTWNREGGAILITGELIHRGNTLEFKAVKKEDRGLYYCSAKNGVRNNAYHESNIVVEFPPIVNTSKPIRTQALKNFIDLHCHVEGFPTPSIVWLHNEDELISHSNIKINNLASSLEVTDSILHIYEVEKHQYGNYTCKASNILGDAEVTITLRESPTPVCPPACS